MRSLFAKIFLCFLLTIILVTSAGVLLTYLQEQQFPLLAHQSFAKHAIEEYGQRAIEVFEHRGIDQVDAFAEELQHDTGIRVILFDTNGRPLTRKHVPRRMQHMSRRVLHSGEVVFPMMGQRNWLASPIEGSSGRKYIVALGLPDQPPMEHMFKGLTRGLLGWRLLLLLLVTAVVCFGLARSLTSPISRLRQAARQFATGDLSTRVGDKVKSKTELGGLARDFDHMAERIEDLVGAQQRLLRDISHELRSPLARLGVALELARQEGKPEVQEKAFARIELEAERMNEMIGQLLSLTRLESGDRELQRQQFDLAELLTDLVQDADYEAKNRGCRVLFHDDGPVPFHGSQELLARALENVIRNAVKYTADATSVSVELARLQREIVIRILDQGPGVPEEALDKLFEPFYRVADARDRQSGGTGIGLAIADRSVKLHSGRIKATNHPEGGLMVEIVLPSSLN